MLKLLQELQPGNEAIDVQAGQQAPVGKTEKTDAQDVTVDATAQIACLLGSMGVILTAPEVATVPNMKAPETTPQITAQQIQPQTAAVSATVQVVPEQFAQPTQPADPQASAAVADAVVKTVVPTTEDGKSSQKPAVKVAEPGTVQVKETSTEAPKTTDQVQPLADEIVQTSAKPSETRKDEPNSAVAASNGGVPASTAPKDHLVQAVTAGANITAPLNTEQRSDSTQAVRQAVVSAVEGRTQAVATEIVTPAQKSEQQKGSSLGQPEQSQTPFVQPEHIRMAVPVGTDAAPVAEVSQPTQTTGAQMINQIVRSAQVHTFDGGAGMTLRLDPPHLGTVQMNVTVANGNVTASLQTSTESARQILQADLGNLKQMLTDAGVRVDQVNVSVGADASQNWNLYSGHQNGAQQQEQARTPGWYGGTAPGSDAGPELAASGVRAERQSGSLNFLA